MRRSLTKSAVVLAAASILTLSACSNGDTGDDNLDTGAETQEDGEESEGGERDGLIAVITPAHSNEFFKAEADAAVAAAEELGYTAQSDSHDDDPNKQSELIDSAISNDAAAIILDNAGADVTVGAVEKAKDAGIPVFLIDREINESDIAVSQIVADNSQGAGLVAEAFVEELEGEGKYFELFGIETDTNADVRSDAFHSVIDQYEDMEQVGVETANWDQQEAFEKVQTILQNHDDIDGIIAGNDTMAVGAVAAVEEAGLLDDIVIAGFDGAPDAVEAIKEGKMLATAMQPAVQLAEMAVEQADAYIQNGETGLPEKQSVNCVLIDDSNAEQYTLFELDD